jgi:uncharacterized repeat protein (TIGR03803 family)
VSPSLALAGTSYQAIWKFSKKTGDVATPYDGLVADSSGTLYGTGSVGGAKDLGGVFAVTPSPVPGGKATEAVLWSFSGPDGSKPYGALVRDPNTGILYGTTTVGGSANFGTVFALTPPATGQTQWTETVLWNFAGGSDGANPYAGLMLDANGALYGTTEYGGKKFGFCSKGCGTVFKLTPPAAGQTSWSKTVVWSFSGSDGYFPYAGVIADQNGALYGTTLRNSQGYGSVFRLTPPAAGQTAWTESTLLVFPWTLDDGSTPYGGLLLGANGTLYGCTQSGGALGGGVAFSLTPPAAGKTQWPVTIISQLREKPMASLIADAAGNLYGTGETVGTGGLGTVFELVAPPPGQKAWTEVELWQLISGEGASHPHGALLQQSDGSFVTTATSTGNGSVFVVSP